MGACKFQLIYTGDIGQLYRNVQNLATANSAILDGNLTEGRFEIIVSGNKYSGRYIVQGSNISVELESKPFFIPCSMLELMAKQYLAKR